MSCTILTDKEASFIKAGNWGDPNLNFNIADVFCDRANRQHAHRLLFVVLKGQVAV